MVESYARAKILTRGGDEAIAANELVAVYLESIEVDTTQFRSKDGFLFFVSKEREGIVKIGLSGQTTTIPFFGKGDVHPKYLDKVAYLGVYCGGLSFDISLLELDEEERQWLDPLRKGAEWIAKLPMAPPGFDFFSPLFNFLKSQIDDDEEVRAFLFHEKPLRHGETMDVIFGDKNNPLLHIRFKVERLGKIENYSKLSVRIADPQLSFVDQSQARRELEKKGMNLFNFEATCGNSSSAYSTDVSRALETMTWQKNELFIVRGANVGNYVLPLFLNFSINPKRFNAEAFEQGLETGVKLSQSMGADTKQIRQIVKQIPSVLNFISEITSNSFSIFAFNGFILLSQSTKKKREFVPGKMVLHWSKREKLWQAHVEKELSWKDNRFGMFSFDIEVKEVPKG